MTARRRLVALAVVATVAGVLLIHPPARRVHPSGGRPPVVAPAPAGPVPAPAPGPRAVSLAFVSAYVALVYGRIAAADLPDASAYVRAQARAEHPDPPGVVRAAADPSLRSLGVTAAGPSRARGVARVADGLAVYELVVELRRRPAGWTVTDVQETS